MIEITKPEELGFSSKRLERLTEWLGEQVSGDRLAGASVLVGRRGKVAYLNPLVRLIRSRLSRSQRILLCVFIQ